ncbi:MAG TPA: hypothetical protein ENN05_09420 [Deltaproteobacteria bacterium]|nr:hypothetical protein [Deltaproteobacteria bacterium]
MKRLSIFLFLLFLGVQPIMAQSHYDIEVLQLGDNETFDRAYDGLLDGLARQGLVKGYNLSVTRTVIDTSPADSLWGKLLCYLSTRNIGSQVIRRNPDMVVTIGTSATKYFQKEIVSAGIPLVYTSAIDSVTYLKQKTSGVAINTTAVDVINASLLALPNIRTLGIIHSNDNDAVAFVHDMKVYSQRLGLKIISREVGMGESILPAANELIAQQIDAFVVPADGYYELKGWKASKELMTVSRKNSLPCISSLVSVTDGPFLYLSPDFQAIGDLTAACVKDILVENIQPQERPITALNNNNYVVDLKVSREIGIAFRPMTPDLLSLND